MVYKDKVHPGMLHMLIEVDSEIRNLKLILLAAVAKEYGRFPKHNFEIHSLGQPWWLKRL